MITVEVVIFENGVILIELFNVKFVSFWFEIELR
jgi:hypothetical protein